VKLLLAARFTFTAKMVWPLAVTLLGPAVRASV